ncbi:juvenile hormone esterase [Helicoverpa zea nudivirus 2]|uniref:Juvenile hormone esterase n=1 Tax=Helicoverpa zea nudivirus 2 TaxID=1128424 RepID=G9I033_HZNV2|nr:orf7 gene product [Helicoverpa zea nudivirus 2]AEW69556.1 juvenile hormone esterase [Helicoverpa zea nudivirus 2]
MANLLLVCSLFVVLVKCCACCEYKTDAGCLVGQDDQVTNTVNFLGIPYGVGRRFNNAKLYRASPNDTMHADTDIECIQGDSLGTEHCLTLNVYKPQGTVAASRFRVVVVVHGRDYYKSDAHSERHRYSHFTDADFVVVHVNYRLSVFGFLCIDRDLAPSNVGVHDVRLAVQWVKRNIAAFNGDSESINLLGYGYGAVIVHILAWKGLMVRTVTMFDSPLLYNTDSSLPYKTDSVSAINEQAVCTDSVIRSARVLEFAKRLNLTNSTVASKRIERRLLLKLKRLDARVLVRTVHRAETATLNLHGQTSDASVLVQLDASGVQGNLSRNLPFSVCILNARDALDFDFFNVPFPATTVPVLIAFNGNDSRFDTLDGYWSNLYNWRLDSKRSILNYTHSEVVVPLLIHYLNTWNNNKASTVKHQQELIVSNTETFLFKRSENQQCPDSSLDPECKHFHYYNNSRFTLERVPVATNETVPFVSIMTTVGGFNVSISEYFIDAKSVGVGSIINGYALPNVESGTLKFKFNPLTLLQSDEPSVDVASVQRGVPQFEPLPELLVSSVPEVATTLHDVFNTTIRDTFTNTRDDFTNTRDDFTTTATLPTLSNKPTRPSSTHNATLSYSTHKPTLPSTTHKPTLPTSIFLKPIRKPNNGTTSLIPIFPLKPTIKNQTAVHSPNPVEQYIIDQQEQTLSSLTIIMIMILCTFSALLFVLVCKFVVALVCISI